MKRLVKLINNERTNTKLLSPKACDATSTDTCYVYDRDGDGCTVYSTDICNKDHAGCTIYSYDNCTFYFSDYDPCSAYEEDYSDRKPK